MVLRIGGGAERAGPSPGLPKRAGGRVGSRGLVVPWSGQSPRGGQRPPLGCFARPDAVLAAPRVFSRKNEELDSIFILFTIIALQTCPF